MRPVTRGTFISFEGGEGAGKSTQIRRLADRLRADGAEVVLFTIEGGGHTWPNGWQYLGEAIIGKTTKDIDATALLVDFLKRHPLP